MDGFAQGSQLVAASQMIADAIRKDGFASPVPLYSPAASLRVLARLAKAQRRHKAAWHKGWAAISPAFFDVASDPRILDVVTAVLGEDVILWGASLIRKTGNEVHPFHTDVESCRPEGGFVSVWIGLENTGPKAGLKYIPGSHLYGTTIQEANARLAIARKDSVGDAALRAAALFDPDPRIVQPEAGNGLAFFFDGRVWHGSHNEQSGEARTALLLQYASARAPVYIPKSVEWPLSYVDALRPPVILLAGRAPHGVNTMVAAPSEDGEVPNSIHRLVQGPLEAVAPWAPQPHFDGRTPNAATMESHTSMLAPGAIPHDFHHHRQEELLVIVEGEAELAIADDRKGANARRQTMRAGDFAYYPAFGWHTLTNRSDKPVLYTMFRWDNPQGATASPLAAGFFAGRETLMRSPDAHNLQAKVFESRTRWLNRLRAHVTVMPEGGGYDAHADRHDVAIVLIEGEIRTLGETVAAPAMIFHPAGQEHGLRNAGQGPARYVVFEFERGDFTLPSEGRFKAWRRNWQHWLRSVFHR
jgi:mannose-6-phosphate isomerase-like protein (cupin superfamily)